MKKKAVFLLAVVMILSILPMNVFGRDAVAPSPAGFVSNHFTDWDQSRDLTISIPLQRLRNVATGGGALLLAVQVWDAGISSDALGERPVWVTDAGNTAPGTFTLTVMNLVDTIPSWQGTGFRFAEIRVEYSGDIIPSNAVGWLHFDLPAQSDNTDDWENAWLTMWQGHAGAVAGPSVLISQSISSVLRFTISIHGSVRDFNSALPVPDIEFRENLSTAIRNRHGDHFAMRLVAPPFYRWSFDDEYVPFSGCIHASEMPEPPGGQLPLEVRNARGTFDNATNHIFNTADVKVLSSWINGEPRAAGSQHVLYITVDANNRNVLLWPDSVILRNLWLVPEDSASSIGDVPITVQRGWASIVALCHMWTPGNIGDRGRTEADGVFITNAGWERHMVVGHRLPPDFENRDITDSFTCPNFLAVVREVTGIPAPGRIYWPDVVGIDSISAFERGLTSLDGIEYFTALTSLDVGWNNLTTLDVSNNTALIALGVGDNNLTNLDVSNNTALITLGVGSNNLTNLDVSNNTALTSLNVGWHNNFTTLDVSNNTALTELGVGRNNLTTLDVSNNTALTRLDVMGNNLTNLDVSNNTALTSLNVGSNSLTNLDISNNTKLAWLDVRWNNLTTLDASNNTAITWLNAYNNNLTALDIRNSIALASLSVWGNNLTNLDVSNNTALTSLEVGGNNLTTLDISNNTALTSLEVGGNNLTTLDVRNNTALTWLVVRHNYMNPTSLKFTYRIFDGLKNQALLFVGFAGSD